MKAFRIGDLVQQRLTQSIGVIVWSNHVKGVRLYTVDFSGHFKVVSADELDLII